MICVGLLCHSLRTNSHSQQITAGKYYVRVLARRRRRGPHSVSSDDVQSSVLVTTNIVSSENADERGMDGECHRLHLAKVEELEQVTSGVCVRRQE